jgi:hypothetical protein
MPRTRAHLTRSSNGLGQGILVWIADADDFEIDYSDAFVEAKG